VVLVRMFVLISLSFGSRNHLFYRRARE